MWQHPRSVASWKEIVMTVVKIMQMFGFENKHLQFSRCKHVTAHRLMKTYHVKIFRMLATLNDHALSDINSSLIQTSCHKAAFSTSCPNSVAAGNNLCNADFLVLPVGPIIYHMPSSQRYFSTISTSLYSQASTNLSFCNWQRKTFCQLARTDRMKTVYSIYREHGCEIA